MRPATLSSPAGLWKSGAVTFTIGSMGPSAAALVLAACLGAGCAKAPTDVLTSVNADATVPPLLILRVTVVGSTGTSSGGLRSTAQGDAADRPAPFTFPMLLPVNADPAAAGSVTITIDGLDWDTRAVLASGSTTARIVPEHETRAALTLSAVPGGGTDGGEVDGAGGEVDGAGSEVDGDGEVDRSTDGGSD